MSNNPQGTNPLGNASLALGVASAALVFGIGLCLDGRGPELDSAGRHATLRLWW